MLQDVQIILMGLSLLVSLTTLFTFWTNQKKAAEANGARQATLDAAITAIQQAIVRMTEQIARQQEALDQLKLWIELLLQQHTQNHGQTIRRQA